MLDATAALRKVSSLRALGLRLPHVPTPAELVLLDRFQDLVTAPGSATSPDRDALAAGWRQWWRQGERTRIRDMADTVPGDVVAGDARLIALAAAARL
jgi:hypothetical protein